MSPEAIDARYRLALTDWLACAYAGRDQDAAGVARAAGAELSDRVVAAGTAGHVLDFDDTYVPGLSHLSAPVAPAACVLGAEIDATVGDVLSAYAAGFEAMGAVARASYPTMYERGWHPTAACGVVGSAVAAAHLLGIDVERAVNVALLSAGGLQAAFGSHGKSLQVGFAAATGVRAARLVAAGARVPPVATGRASFEEAYGATWAKPDAARPAVDENWIKAYPCCLQTHGAIEVAAQARAAGVDAASVEVIVHPVSLRAAPYEDAADGLEAKFSIPYTVAFTLLHGLPGVRDFDSVDRAARELARKVRVTTDAALLESEAILKTGEGFEARVEAALGSPLHPMTPKQLHEKVESLAEGALTGVLDDPAESAKVLLDASGLA